MTSLENLMPGSHRLPCPKCDKGPRDDALSATVEAPGKGVFQCFRCGWSGRIGGKQNEPIQRFKSKLKLDKTGRVQALIDRSQAIRGTVAEEYLRSRAIVVPRPGGLCDDAALRFVPRMLHWPTGKKFPCMIAPLTNAITNKLQGGHLTFLAADGCGKANVDKPRLYVGPKGGGVVRLTANEDVTTSLCVGEGIETSFAGIMGGYPTWACLDTGNLAQFPVLDGIEALTILADNDQPGLNAAKKCAAQWTRAGREATVTAAPDGDWNDWCQREVFYA